MRREKAVNFLLVKTYKMLSVSLGLVSKNSPKKISMKRISSADIDENTLRAIWEVRKSFITLTGDLSDEQDWEGFKRFYSKPNRVLNVCYNPKDEVIGCFTVSYELENVNGKNILVLEAEHAYLLKEGRGSWKYMHSIGLAVMDIVERHRYTETYFTGFFFPNSFVFFKTVMGDYHTFLTGDLTETEEILITRFVERNGKDKWDDSRKLAKYDMVPPKTNKSSKVPQFIRDIQDEYDRINPDWEDGWALPVIAPVNGSAVKNTLARLARRSVRK